MSVLAKAGDGQLGVDSEHSTGPFITKRRLERKVYNVRRQFTSAAIKEVRAQAIRDRAGQGKVYLPRSAPWVIDFYQELLRFPAGRYDDQCDSFGLIGRMLDEMIPGSKPPPPPKPLDAMTVVTGLQMPIDWHFKNSTNEAVLRLGGDHRRI